MRPNDVTTVVTARLMHPRSVIEPRHWRLCWSTVEWSPSGNGNALCTRPARRADPHIRWCDPSLAAGAACAVGHGCGTTGSDRHLSSPRCGIRAARRPALLHLSLWPHRRAVGPPGTAYYSPKPYGSGLGTKACPRGSDDRTMNQLSGIPGNTVCCVRGVRGVPPPRTTASFAATSP
jgi:hypothetical protein